MKYTYFVSYATTGGLNQFGFGWNVFHLKRELNSAESIQDLHTLLGSQEGVVGKVIVLSFQLIHTSKEDSEGG